MALLATVAVELAIIASRLPVVQEVRIAGLGDQYRIWGLPVTIDGKVRIKDPVAVTGIWGPLQNPIKVECVRGCR